MVVKLVLYIITVPLSIWALDSININGLFRVNRVFQARLLYFMTSFGLAYLLIFCMILQLIVRLLSSMFLYWGD